MKKSILLIASLFFIANGITYAQNPVLLGMTANGGANNAGVIFKIKYDGSGFKVLYSFATATGQHPYGNLIRANNGLFYGLANSGGSNQNGAIFSFDTATNKYTDVYDFGTTDGYNPGGTLLQATNGKLYGMTPRGGANNLGVLFRFNPANNGYTKLVDFNGTNGATPYNNSLIQARNGLLYGLTFQGGQNNFGAFFSYNLINSTYNSYNMPEDDFAGFTASVYPNGRLIESIDGLLRGTTGSSCCGCNNLPREGTLMAFDPGNNATGIAYDFTNEICLKGAIANGAYPYGSLVEQSAGVFYGMNNGDAAYGLLPNIFKYQSSNGAVAEIFDFSVSDGNFPYGSFITGNDGNLYAMTWSGGANNFGVIFRFNAANNSYLKIHDFDGAHGANPYADLITCILPARPGVIAGNFLFCPGSTQIYSISPVPGATSYKWTVPTGSSIQGTKTGVSITVLMGSTTGSIKVKAQNECGISPVTSKTLVIHCTTLAQAQAHIASIADISPNPTTGNITLQFNSSAKDNYSVRVIDMVGKIVMNTDGKTEPGLNTIHLDLSKFAKGIYMVQLQAGNKKELIRKVVLQ